jgi:hypothetical protein
VVDGWLSVVSGWPTVVDGWLSVSSIPEESGVQHVTQ